MESRRQRIPISRTKQTHDKEPQETQIRRPITRLNRPRRMLVKPPDVVQIEQPQSPQSPPETPGRHQVPHKIKRISLTEKQIDDIIKYKKDGLPENMPKSTKYKWKERLNHYTVKDGDLYVDEKQVIRPSKKMKVLEESYNVPVGQDNYFEIIARKYWNISKNDVDNFINSLEYKQVHRPVYKQGIIKPVLAYAPHKIYQADLVIFDKLGRSNRGYNYLLTMIDLFSKYGCAIPLKKKDTENIVEGFKEALEIMGNPSVLQTDRGSEFISAEIKEELTKRGIKQIFSKPYQPTSQGQIERFNKTLKSWLLQLLTKNNTKHWIKYLPEVLEAYNSLEHTSTGHAPNELKDTTNKKLIAQVKKRLQAKATEVVTNDKLPEIKVGSKVRVSVLTDTEIRKNAFNKRLNQNWSGMVFKVYKTYQSRKPFMSKMYQVESLEGTKYGMKYRRDQLLLVPDITVKLEHNPQPYTLEKEDQDQEVEDVKTKNEVKVENPAMKTDNVQSLASGRESRVKKPNRKYQ
jgi:hypothetical protein